MRISKKKAGKTQLAMGVSKRANDAAISDKELSGVAGGARAFFGSVAKKSVAGRAISQPFNPRPIAPAAAHAFTGGDRTVKFPSTAPVLIARAKGAAPQLVFNPDNAHTGFGPGSNPNMDPTITRSPYHRQSFGGIPGHKKS
jgi:hypothetical protein